MIFSAGWHIIRSVNNDMHSQLRFKRVLLKLSGEVLGDRSKGECLDPDRLAFMAERVKAVRSLGVQTAIVIGGGNIFRGLSGAEGGMDRVAGDSMGMLATAINALALSAALGKTGVPSTVMTATPMPKFAELCDAARAIELLDAGRVVIFAGGTGNPFFSTDSGAALRAAEIRADALLKATKVDGIYTADPKKDSSAVRYTHLDYSTALAKRLKVMDAAAFALCMDNSIPIVVFDFFGDGAFESVVTGGGAGTVVDGN